MKIPKIDTIPPELCTVKEAVQILGLKTATINLRSQRFKGLRFTKVRIGRTLKLLFNRAEVERYKFPERPEGYYDTKEITKMLGFKNTMCTNGFLREHDVPHIVVKASHAYYLYKKEDIDAIKQEMFPENEVATLRSMCLLPRLDEIPPELCTRKEAAKILGVSYPSLRVNSPRFKNLRFTEVVYKGKRHVLFNRKEIQALVYPVFDYSDCITIEEASRMLNYCPNHPKTCAKLLVEHSIPRELVRGSHPYYVYSRKAVEELRAKRAANHRCKK